jgi:hypothetical protein
MAVAYVSVGAGTEISGNTSASANVPYPASIAAGDLLLMMVTGNDFGSGRPTTTPPADWALKDSVLLGSVYKMEVLRKIASGSESGNLNVTVTAAGDFQVQARILRFTGNDTSASPFESGGTDAGTGTTAAADAVTSTVDDSLAVIFAMSETGGGYGLWTGETGGDYARQFEGSVGHSFGFFTAELDIGTISGGGAASDSGAWGTISFNIKAPSASAPPVVAWITA